MIFTTNGDYFPTHN